MLKAIAITAGIVSCVFTAPVQAHHHCPGNVTDPLCTPFGAVEQQEDRGGAIRGSGRWMDQVPGQ